jgi:hypothetical protein
MQTWGRNYWETYAPVVNWASIRLILAIAKIHGLFSKSINFVLGFPQADLDVPVYMKLPIVLMIQTVKIASSMCSGSTKVCMA